MVNTVVGVSIAEM